MTAFRFGEKKPESFTECTWTGKDSRKYEWYATMRDRIEFRCTEDEDRKVVVWLDDMDVVSFFELENKDETKRLTQWFLVYDGPITESDDKKEQSGDDDGEDEKEQSGDDDDEDEKEESDDDDEKQPSTAKRPRTEFETLSRRDILNRISEYESATDRTEIEKANVILQQLKKEINKNGKHASVQVEEPRKMIEIMEKHGMVDRGTLKPFTSPGQHNEDGCSEIQLADDLRSK